MLFVSFPMTAAVEISLTVVAVDRLAVLGTSTFVVESVRDSVFTVSVSLAAVALGASAVISASAATYVVDTSLVSTAGAAVLRGVEV